MYKFNCQIMLLVISILVLSGNTFGQESCEVKLESIKGIYSGECLNQKANGKGKSIGTDQYEGEFKDGYPDGKGMYVWPDDHYFIGNFIKGKKEGFGEMYYQSISGDDSLITGFWRKDKYSGKYEVPYKLISSSGLINRVNFILKKGRANEISITIRDQGGSTGVYSLKHTFIKQHEILTGDYTTSFSTSESGSKNSIFENVTFPFEMILYLTNGESTRFLLYEQGTYEILIDVK